MPDDIPDDALFPQFINDVVALGIRVRIGSVRHLERQAGQRYSSISGAGSDPKDALIRRRPVRIQPEARCRDVVA